MGSDGGASDVVGSDSVQEKVVVVSTEGGQYSKLTYPSHLLKMKEENDKLKMSLLRGGGGNGVGVDPVKQEEKKEASTVSPAITTTPAVPTTNSLVNSAFTITHKVTKNALIIDAESWLATASDLEPLERKTFLFEAVEGAEEGTVS